MTTAMLLLDLPGRDQAREAAHRELSRPEYQQAKPPLIQQAINWLLDELGTLFSGADSAVPGGIWGLLVLTALAAGLIALLFVKLRPSRSRTMPGALFGADIDRSAQSHRSLAEAAAAQGRYADAVRERLRAVVRELEEHGLLDPRPGRTADEVARDGGAAVPELAGPLAEGARVFDEVWYGGRTADASTYAVLVAVDKKVTGTRLVPA